MAAPELTSAPPPLSRPPAWLKLGIGLAAVTLSALMALNTGYGLHPDERLHVAGFRYFETRWWPPELGSDAIVYSPDGTSRVFTGELVYLIYGKIAHAILAAAAIPDPTQEVQAAYRVYRLLNTALLACTLAMLFRVRRRTLPPVLLGLTLVCLPQAIYLYSYANSDAWGLSLTLALFVFALGQVERPRPAWTLGRSLLLGLLIGLILSAKPTFWPALPFALLPLVGRLLPGAPALPRRWALGLLVASFAALLVAAPLKIVYPLSQGNYAQKYEQMREAKARDDFKPSQVAYPGYRLAARGAPFRQVAADPQWWRWSAQSFYGVFGYFNVFLPRWLYLLAAAGAASLLLMTLGAAAKLWLSLPPLLRLLLAAAPFAAALALLASLYNSWTYDYQPQGRYLFGALLPLAVLWLGTLPWEPRRLQALRWAVWAALYATALYTLIEFVLRNPNLALQ